MVDSLLEPASNELQLSGLVLKFLAERLVLLRHSTDLSQLVLEITQHLNLVHERNKLGIVVGVEEMVLKHRKAIGIRQRVVVAILCG